MPQTWNFDTYLYVHIYIYHLVWCPSHAQLICFMVTAAKLLTQSGSPMFSTFDCYPCAADEYAISETNSRTNTFQSKCHVFQLDCKIRQYWTKHMQWQDMARPICIFLQHVATSFNGWVYWIIYRKPSFRRPLARNFCDVMRPRDDGDRHLCCRLGAVQRWFIDQERKLPLTEPTGSVGFFLWYPRDQKISWLAETWTMAKCHPEIIILIIFIFIYP